MRYLGAASAVADRHRAPCSSLVAILSTTPTSCRARPSIHGVTDAESPGAQGGDRSDKVTRLMLALQGAVTAAPVGAILVLSRACHVGHHDLDGD